MTSPPLHTHVVAGRAEAHADGSQSAGVLRGRVVLPGRVVDDGAVAVLDDRIVAAGPRAEVAAELDRRGVRAIDVPHPDGVTLLPGLVDLHCHGALGHEFGTDEQGAREALRHHHAHGTTTVVTSLVSAPSARLREAVAVLAGLHRAGLTAGLHLEGPFLADARRGAQDPAALRPVDLGELGELLDAGAGSVVAMTLAPELPGAADAVDLLAEAGVLPAVGHTDADAATTSAALLRARARLGGRRPLVTHLFNGMAPLHHRAPGAAGAALAAVARGDAVAELIADGQHLSDETVAMVFAAARDGAVALVSDATAATGMPDGSYRLGALEVSVEQGVARLREGDSLAGSAVTLLDVVRRAHAAGVSLDRAVAAASVVPAGVLGIADQVGALQPGRWADVVAVDDDLRPLEVWRPDRPTVTDGSPGAS